MVNEKAPEPTKNREPSEQALLTEYQVCQSDSNAMITTHWTVVGIFLGVSTGVLGWLVKTIASGGINFNLTNSWIIIIFGLSMALITGLLICWLIRVNCLVDANEKVMRRIENNTGMENRPSPRNIRGIKGQDIMIVVYSILIAMWTAIVLPALSIVSSAICYWWITTLWIGLVLH